MAALRTYVLAAVMLAVVPVVAVMGINAFIDAHDEQARVEKELRRSSFTLAQIVEQEAGATYEALVLLARSDAIQQGEPARLGRLQEWRPRRDWDSVFVLDREGTVLMDTRASAAPDASLGELHRRISAAGRPAAAPVVDASSGGIAAIALAVPVRQAGMLRYVVGARVASPTWQTLLAAAGLPEGARASLIDGRSRVIADTDSQLDAPAAADVAASPEPAGVRRSNDTRGQAIYAAWQSLPATEWRVVVSMIAGPVDAAQRRGTIVALVAGTASLLLGAWLALLLGRRIATPLQRLAHLGPASVPDDVPVREIALLRDAMARDRTEEEGELDALQAQAQEYEMLFNRSPVATAFAQDTACRAIAQNEAMDRLVGPPGSGKARSVRLLHKGEPLARADQPLQRAAAHGETVADMELEIAAEGSASTFVMANAVALRGIDGEVRGAICTFTDVTQRRLAESRLLASGHKMREAHRLMERAQQSGEVGFFDYRFRTDRLVWTTGLCRLHGITAFPNGGLRQWYELADPGDRDRIERELWTACALRRERETIEYGVVWRDGSVHRLSARLLLHYDGEGRASQMVGVTVDMTERRRADSESVADDERAAAAPDPAVPAHRIDDEFLARLSHKLRNPLGAILSATYVLERDRAGSEGAMEARKIISRQTRALSQIVHDLLDDGHNIQRQDSEPALDAPAPRAEPGPTASKRRNVLVVEDNRDVLDALCSRLELDGHSVSTAADGVEGLARLLKLRPEVSIVDIGLPGLTGYELARHARAAGYAGRMIAISGAGAEGDAQAALVAGFDAYLAKPVEDNELSASLRAD